MELTKKKCKKEGFERYYDFTLTWTYQDKVFKVKVRPVFATDNKFLIAAASEEEESKTLN